MNDILRALFSHSSHYSAVLPYNLRWRLSNRKLQQLKPFLKENPLSVYDIGARGGDLGEITNLRPYLDYYAFDADTAEAEALKKSQASLYANFSVFPVFIGETVGKSPFYIYKHPAQSSVYLPADRFKDQFAGPEFAMQKKIMVETTTLDKFRAADKHRAMPDLLKIDTQGSELSILRAATKTLQETLLVEVECEFIEMYKGQALFHDISSFLYSNGFELLYMNRVFGNRLSYHREARGQITFCDALFVKREDHLKPISDERVAKLMILLANYGHLDLAWELGKVRPSILTMTPAILSLFQKNPRSSLGRKIAKIMSFFWNTYNKILLLLFAVRRTNNLSMDSDRSWPMR